MKEKKGIDDVFKHGLEDPVNEPAFRESDWDNFEHMLDKKRHGGRVFWLPVLSSAAAIMLIFFGWLMFKPKADKNTQNTQQVANHTVPASNSATAVTSQHLAANGTRTNGTTTKVAGANTPVSENNGNQHGNVQPRYLTDANYADKKASSPKRKWFGASAIGSNRAAADTVQPYLAMVPVNTNEVIIDHLSGPNAVDVSAEPRTGINAVPITATKPTVKTKVGSGNWRPQYALSVLAAPEVTGVGSFNSTSSGTNVGLLFTVGINKFSASTGASYSTKPYSMPFNNYHSAYQFKTDPQTVTADCRVLDIPINVGYQLYNKSRNKFTVGTGISSYVMLHESYAYDYGNAASPGPASYAVKGKGKYFFSIMNLQASYERKVASNVGLSLTPYLKLPLADIGYSQVKIQTFGVAVGLNWNINSLTKPK